MNLDNDLPYWVAWSRLPKIGATRFALLRRAFTSLEQAWQVSGQQLKQIGFDDNLVQEIILHRQRTDIGTSWQEIQALKLKVTVIADDNYPALLKEINDPPPIIFWQGNWDCLNSLMLATVGARRITSYGQQVVAKIIPPLAQAGLTIVSGLAYGVDAACHQATLQVGGKTVAVLASGLDQVYPSANRYLASKIIETAGLLLTEHPPGVLPLKHHFPIRNRIIAGLCRATLVIEAAKTSGALITAKQALEYNRDVFAIPGSILSEQSEGTNELIRLGAIPVAGPEEILNNFNLSLASQTNINRAFSELEKNIIELIKNEPQHIDEIARTLKLPAGDITAKLTLLELEGFIKNAGNQKFVSLT
ncbi:MAG: DNA-processing protein DprA [Patescibacteria group bacterium]